MFAILLIISTLFADSSKTEVGLMGHYGQSTYAIEGDRAGGFSVQAASVHDIDSVSRVFGVASYSWQQSHGNRFVENADYDLLYPYLTVDTVGGGLRSETYFFRGGYRMRKNHIAWYAALQFRALQSYRAVDPRPKNKVADLRVDAGIGYVGKRFTWMAFAEGGRYKQNNEIKFYSELGESQIYHLIAPGSAYTRFSGSKKESYYHGFTAGAGIAMLPLHGGWLAMATYRHLSVTKELHDNTFIPIGRIRTHTIDATVGYTAEAWQAVLQAGTQLRRGQQYIYGEAVNNTYTLLTTANNYSENGWHIGAEGNYSWALPFGELTVGALMDYNASNTSCPEPEPRWQTLYDLLTEDVLTTGAVVRYEFPITKRLSWFVEPLADYLYYTNASRHTWQAVLRTGITF